MARIGELLAARPTLSFEFFPPKTDEAERALEKTVADLAELRPSFVSVTYGAGGSTRERTRDIVVRINRDHPFPAMAHLTCVGHTRADIAQLLDEYAESGVENILALGGDPPADGSDPGGDFAYASDLVEQVRAHPAGFSIGVAAHPELHPRSTSTDDDRRRLATKLEMADFGVTQFFFELDPYLRMVDELGQLGCDKPVLPGIMPVINVAGVQRMAGMNGTHIPPPLLERLVAVEDQPDEVAKIGVETATALGAALLAEDAPGLHIYAMNRSAAPREIHANLALG
ncbi:MAG: methylenetetrahydrofolate reductase [Acidimicrobiales bacterium]|nr:methylenetetrahydrofolate reductase [Acidimicrobiales bacterium]